MLRTHEAAMPETVINFYSTSGEYGCFSNFSRHSIFLNGKRWPTSEHFFQAMKFQGTEHEEQVRMAKKPMEAASMGRERKRPLRRDWESVKDGIMLEAVRAKFTQHDDLKATLLGTGDAKLVEHTANDSYWGDGGDGSGKNRLGQILMQVRTELRTTAAGK
jgi:N-glycosidase YbiA